MNESDFVQLAKGPGYSTLEGQMCMGLMQFRGSFLTMVQGCSTKGKGEQGRAWKIRRGRPVISSIHPSIEFY